MSKPPADLLESAANAFARHHEEMALAHLFEAWGRARVERIGALIERLATRLSARFNPPVHSPWPRADTQYKAVDLRMRIERFRTRDDSRRPKPLAADAAAHCAALEQALSEREAAEARLGPTLEALFAQVYANPDDDTPRLVLADALMELGEPRGRYMMLQLNPGVDTLEHGNDSDVDMRRWLFPLAPYGDLPHWSVFERGFPAVVCPRFPPNEPLKPPGPAWATVRELNLLPSQPRTSRHLPDWLLHPHLRGVKTLRGVSPRLARELCTRPLPVQRLELLNADPDNGIWAQEPELFTHLCDLPHLVQVDVQRARPEDLALCASSPLAARLERFEAHAVDQWALAVTLPGDRTVEARLDHPAHVPDLARALRAAMGFGPAALRFHLRTYLSSGDRRALEDAATHYTRVEWTGMR